MIKRIVGLTVAATALLSVAAPALARAVPRRLVPFTSLAGVRFGWTPAHVRRALGKPVKQARAGDEPGVYYYSVGGDQNLDITFEPNSPHDGVSAMGINGGHFRAIKGITTGGTFGGTSRAAVVRAFRHYPHFSCRKDLYCTTTRGARDVTSTYGAVELEIEFLDGKLIGFDMTKNTIR